MVAETSLSCILTATTEEKANSYLPESDFRSFLIIVTEVSFFILSNLLQPSFRLEFLIA